MAKRLALIALIVMMIICMTTSAYCDDAIKKLGRGFCNVLTSPIEMANQPSRVNNSDGPMAAITYGILKGVVMTGYRALVGVYEIATFPIPVPKDYGPILKDPEFFFEDQNW